MIETLLQEARRAGSRGVRSPLYDWLRQYHDRILAKQAGVRIPWATLLPRLIPLGIVDGMNRPPTTTIAVATWRRVRQAVAREQAQRADQAERKDLARSATAALGSQAGDLAPGVRPVFEARPAADVPIEPDRAPGAPTFGPARPRGMAPRGQTDTPPAPMPSRPTQPPTQDPDTVMNGFMGPSHPARPPRARKGEA